jgi:hypothetical protein
MQHAHSRGPCRLDQNPEVRVCDPPGKRQPARPAVRCPGVTLPVQILEGQGLVKATRRRIHVVDRDGLNAPANWPDGLPEREYARVSNNTAGWITDLYFMT